MSRIELALLEVSFDRNYHSFKFPIFSSLKAKS